jgi:dienelactone hydrolase
VHKRALFPLGLPEALAARGVAVAAIDAPGHGDRSPTTAGDAAAIDQAWRAHWRAFAAEHIALEWAATIDELTARPEIDDRRIGYWGLSLGTQYGVGVLAREPRIRAAVLGLSALPKPGPRIAAYAEAVRCPVMFLLQEDDEIAPRDRALALFERLGSEEKVLHASRGAHTDVPPAVFDEAKDWLLARLDADVSARGSLFSRDE